MKAEIFFLFFTTKNVFWKKACRNIKTYLLTMFLQNIYLCFYLRYHRSHSHTLHLIFLPLVIGTCKFFQLIVPRASSTCTLFIIFYEVHCLITFKSLLMVYSNPNSFSYFFFFLKILGTRKEKKTKNNFAPFFFFNKPKDTLLREKRNDQIPN